MSWSRREFIRLAGRAVAGALVGTPVGAQTPPRPSAAPRVTPGSAGAAGKVGASSTAAADLAATRAALLRLVTERALPSEDPWVLMHAVLPLGREAQRASEPVLDFVTRSFAEHVPAGGQLYPAFPLRIEAHPNHFLEIMYATGVPAERRFATKSGAATRTDFFAGAKALFSPATAGDELSWTVSVFTAEMPLERDRFENAEGRSFSVRALVEAAVQTAEAKYADTIAAMRGTKSYGRSALQESPCNGTHMLGGLLDALQHGYRANDLEPRVALLMRAMLFRLGPEVALIDQAIGQSGSPGAQLNADAAKLQFLGHTLENLAFARRHGLYRPSAEESTRVDGAARELGAVVRRIVSEHDLDALRRGVPRAYSVLLGDACHALHGLEASA